MQGKNMAKESARTTDSQFSTTGTSESTPSSCDEQENNTRPPRRRGGQSVVEVTFAPKADSNRSKPQKQACNCKALDSEVVIVTHCDNGERIVVKWRPSEKDDENFIFELDDDPGLIIEVEGGKRRNSRLGEGKGVPIPAKCTCTESASTSYSVFSSSQSSTSSTSLSYSPPRSSQSTKSSKSPKTSNSEPKNSTPRTQRKKSISLSPTMPKASTPSLRSSKGRSRIENCDHRLSADERRSGAENPLGAILEQNNSCCQLPVKIHPPDFQGHGAIPRLGAIAKAREWMEQRKLSLRKRLENGEKT
ncbi:hypothetical protein DFH27DRAFT_651832 [Peziza echinospora]|nr:hypothetical protein DFH27DRAFT_651832 [Peziza echinospora]